MDRRTFLKMAAATSIVPGSGAAAMRNQQEQSALKLDPAALDEVVVTEVGGFHHVCPRWKYVGKNSHLGDHGDHTGDDCLWLKTNVGLVGIGSGRITPAVARRVAGKRLSELFTLGVGSTGTLERADHALFDLVGKVYEIPSWRLIGADGPPEVRIYDGSIYFADLLPEHESRGVGRILDEIDMGLDRGHRAFKIKVGRGFKWMDPDAGLRRDVEVVKAIRKHVGPGIQLMVDANNGFTPERARNFLDAIETELYFVEEMFPENVDEDLRLKEFLNNRGWKTLVADGESAHDVEHFVPYIEAGAIDILQGDIRAFGLTKLWELSRRAAATTGITLAPHNWGSFLGVYMQATLARGIPNFLMAEMDASASPLFDTSAFVFQDGRMTLPDQPGNGLALRQDVWNSEPQSGTWVVRAEG